MFGRTTLKKQKGPYSHLGKLSLIKYVFALQKSTEIFFGALYMPLNVRVDEPQSVYVANCLPKTFKTNKAQAMSHACNAVDRAKH